MEDEKPSKPNASDQSHAAAHIARSKIEQLHGSGARPNYSQDKPGLVTDRRSLAQHQEVMRSLQASGKTQAEIQVAWHEYYEGLKDNEKHEVWQEFYRNQSEKKKSAEKSTESSPAAANHKGDLLTRVAKRSSGSKGKAHAHSLLFGLGMGTFVVFILMFSFFNERIITPFIRPSQNVSATPIIVDPNNSGPVSAESKIIIPKINIEAPVVYDEPSIEEKAIQKALERGVVHYAITPEPGEIGNSVIVGHSSSNILNSGKYKFAFLLLKSLENGDTFIVQKDKKRYVYKVYEKFVTNPKDVSVLNPPSDGRNSIMTLITCDPPGLSTNRLIIQAEQIFPDPDANKKASAQPTEANVPESADLPGNAPSLWQRILDSFN